ncbi:MAG: hypothetical protein CL609_11770 [Anaerolineaceae bacterium]|nr:hypothetical protein [Anaerolineaceae bacterium]
MSFLNKFDTTKITKAVKREWVSVFAAVFLGFNLAATIYFYFIQTGLFSEKQILLAVLLMVAFSILFTFLILIWKKYVFLKLDHKKKYGLAVLSLVIGILWSFSIYPHQENFFLLPTQQIKIEAVSRTKSTNSEDKVVITWFDIAFGQASYSQFQDIQGWTREGSRFYLSQHPPASFSWQGKPGTTVTFKFERGPAMGKIKINWGNNNLETIDLYNISETEDLVVSHTYDIPWYSAFSVWIFAGIFTSFVLYLLFTLWLVWQPRKTSSKQVWIWYALPSFISWSIVLLAYWPGILTPDSISHWTQIHSGLYNDWHSVFYSLLLWVLTRIIDHPAFIGFIQITLLSISSAWGLGEMQKWGIRPIYLWGIAIVQALSFQNMVTVISIWKDIPYSVCLLLLTIQVIKVIRTRGMWLRSIKNVVGIVLVMCGLLLFRKNGLFVVFGTFFLWFVFYTQSWRYLTRALVLTVLIWQGFNLVVVPALHVQINSGKGVSILLHHIIAHFDAGTEISPEQKRHLDSMLPLEEWHYNCGVVNTVLWHSDFDRAYYEKTLDQTTQLFFDTLKKDPWVNIRHQLCASELVWRLYPTTYTFTNDFGHIGQTDEYIWISENEYGIREAPKLPDLNRVMMKYFFWSQDHTLVYVLTWRPALYLYLSIISITMFAWKWHLKRFLLVAAPLILQSATLMLVNLAQDFRYQYGVVLIGFFCLSLWFSNPKVDQED